MKWEKEEWSEKIDRKGRMKWENEEWSEKIDRKW
jgi:hypothetical protein